MQLTGARCTSGGTGIGKVTLPSNWCCEITLPGSDERRLTMLGFHVLYGRGWTECQSLVAVILSRYHIPLGGAIEAGEVQWQLVISHGITGDSVEV